MGQIGETTASSRQGKQLPARRPPTPLLRARLQVVNESKVKHHVLAGPRLLARHRQRGHRHAQALLGSPSLVSDRAAATATWAVRREHQRRGCSAGHAAAAGAALIVAQRGRAGPHDRLALAHVAGGEHGGGGARAAPALARAAAAAARLPQDAELRQLQQVLHQPVAGRPAQRAAHARRQRRRLRGGWSRRTGPVRLAGGGGAGGHPGSLSSCRCRGGRLACRAQQRVRGLLRAAGLAGAGRGLLLAVAHCGRR